VATLTNTVKNTATPINTEFTSADLTWDGADFTWDSAAGPWDNPYSIANTTKNTASLTNQAIS